MVAPLHYASAPINRPVGPTSNCCYQSGTPAREICSTTLCLPARRARHVAFDRLGDSYCRSRIDVAIAHSVLEQYSGLGGRPSGHRNDGKRRLVCVAWPFNCNGHLGLHWSDLRVRGWRFPEAIGFFVGMKINFHRCLDQPNRSVCKGTAKWHSLAPECVSPFYRRDDHEIR
jgi:hypothetical protein